MEPRLTLHGIKSQTLSQRVNAYPVCKIYNRHPKNPFPEYLLAGAACCQFDVF
jgi:hypothetical protein